MQKEYRYKAFISYRHQPFDRKAAITLQKYLETFRPPKQLGKEEKWRIFRDETELPTSSDLSQHIREALENSEYLIVICSSVFAESKWCREEISYFKSLHNNSTRNILALLIDGNPNEVFPEELRWSEEIRKNAEGEEIREKIEVEPLAANITADSERQSFKKLKTEFLRITASLLGCRYDDLYQREQKRKLHRSLAIMGGVTVVIGGIGIYSAVMALKLNEQKRLLQIENYNRMAVQSDYMWEDGKTMDAIENAIDAIPETEEKLSVFSAESATADRLDVFQKENFLPIKKCETTSYVTNIEFVKSGKNIVAQDSTGVYLWETKSGKLLKKYTVEELGMDENVDSWDLKFFVQKEEPLEYIEIENNVSGGNMSADGDTSEMMLYGYKKTDSKGKAENPYFYLICEHQTWKVDSKTGAYTPLEEVTEEQKKWHQNENYTCSYQVVDGEIIRNEEEYQQGENGSDLWMPDGKCSLTVFTGENMEEKKEYQYTKLRYDDLLGSNILSISDEVCYANLTEYKEDGSSEDKVVAYPVQDGVIIRDKVLLEEGIEEEEHFLNATRQEDYFIVQTTSGSQGEFCRYRIYDYSTGKKISEVTVDGYAGFQEKLSVGVLKKENTGNYADIMFQIMEEDIKLIDIHSGKLIYDYKFSNEIVDASYTKLGSILVILKNGKEYLIPVDNIENENKESGIGAIFHEFEAEIDDCTWYEDDYLAVRGNTIYHYKDLQNKACEEIEEDEILKYQTKDKNVKYSDDTKSKTIKPVLQKLQEKSLLPSIAWSHKIEEKLFLFGQDGMLYKVDENSGKVEESLKIREGNSQNSAYERIDDIEVWKTQDSNEVIIQNRDNAWLVNLDKMEIRYEIGDDVKGQFAGYSQKENKVLMENWLEDKYWTCPLYTAEELKEIGNKWKYASDLEN